MESQSKSLTLTLADRPDGAALMKSADGYLAAARAMVIHSQDDFEFAAEELAAVKAKHTQLDQREKTFTKPLLEVIANARDLFAAPKAAMKQAEAAIKGAMLVWADTQRANERRAQAAAEEAAQQRRAVILAEAATARAQALAAEPEAAVAVLEHAAALEMEADVCVGIAAPTREKVAGLAERRQWHAILPEAVEDKVKLLRHIADNPDMLTLVSFNLAPANNLARFAQRAEIAPGLRAEQRTALASRSAS